MLLDTLLTLRCSAATVVLIILGINFGSSTYGFNSPYFAAPLAIGFVTGILTGIYETKFRTDGIFHHDLFKYSSRNFAVSSFIMVSLSNTCWWLTLLIPAFSLLRAGCISLLLQLIILRKFAESHHTVNMLCNIG